MPVLFNLKRNVGKELFVNDDIVKRARLLKRWLKGAQIERLFQASVTFTDALAASVKSSVLFAHLEALRRQLAITDGALRWTILGDGDARPPFEKWAVSFASTGAKYENLQEQEQT